MGGMTTCPDCGAEVVQVTIWVDCPRREGRRAVYAEPHPDGQWVMRDAGDGEPIPVRHNGQKRYGGQERWRLHPCSRRARVPDDLGVVAEVYAGKNRRVAVNVPIHRIEGPQEVAKGDRLTIYDDNGNEVRATVERVEFVARIDLDSRVQYPEVR